MMTGYSATACSSSISPAGPRCRRWDPRLDLLRLEAPRSSATATRYCAPRERRRPKMPNQLPRMVEERVRVSEPRLHLGAQAPGRRSRRINAGWPQTNGNMEALHRTILDDCWRRAFARFLHL